MSKQLPFENYYTLDDVACAEKITAAKEKLGSNLVILGHHYQREEVYRHADITGDSLGLSQQAARSTAKYIVFCGVHFMAEVSDIMTAAEQVTLLPDLGAGCSMADMANTHSVEQAWRELSAVIDAKSLITPITYVNSTAALKAFCANHQGTVCTSTNAKQILEWAFTQRERVLFFPDQHLGRNTAYRMGIPLSDMVVWDYTKAYGGLTHEQIRNAKVFLWKGHCSVHNKFKPEQIDAYLQKHPEALVIAHPEACFEVCERADYVGSTSFIINTIREAAPGTHWLVATELNLVNRLQTQFRAENKIIKFMAPTVSMCSTMFRTDPQHLAWVLENLVAGNIVNQIKVSPTIAEPARLALDTMFSISQ